MAKLFIFSIGGTGERVLRSTTMLLAAGIPAFNNYDIYPIIIDYDADNADKKRTRDILDLYTKINRKSFSKHPISNMPKDDKNKGQFFGTQVKELNGLEKFVLDFNPGKDNLKFRDKIEYDLMSGNLLKTKLLLESLYDTSDDPITELNLDLTVGFKGNPNIGSVIFHKLGERSEYLSFVNNYHKDQGDKVVVIGSLFGGTGASGIPVLIQQILKDHPNAYVATLMIQPYFAPEITPGGAINAHLFYSKTKAALNFYKASKIMSLVKAAYHIGDPYPTIVPYSEGGDTQKNNANPIEFISALAIHHFVSTNFDDINNDDNEWKFGLQCDIVSSKDGEGKTNSCRIFQMNFNQDIQLDIFTYLNSFAYALKYLHETVKGGKLKDSDTYNSILGLCDKDKPKNLIDLIDNLDKFYMLFNEWLNELDYAGNDAKHIQPNSHRLALYELSKDYPEVVEKPIEHENGRQSGIRDIINGIFGNNPKFNGGVITATMNAMITDRKHVDDNKLKTLEREFVFMDILRAACIDLINK